MFVARPCRFEPPSERLYGPLFKRLLRNACQACGASVLAILVGKGGAGVNFESSEESVAPDSIDELVELLIEFFTAGGEGVPERVARASLQPGVTPQLLDMHRSSTHTLMLEMEDMMKSQKRASLLALQRQHSAASPRMQRHRSKTLAKTLSKGGKPPPQPQEEESLAPEVNEEHERRKAIALMVLSMRPLSALIEEMKRMHQLGHDVYGTVLPLPQHMQVSHAPAAMLKNTALKAGWLHRETGGFKRLWFMLWRHPHL